MLENAPTQSTMTELLGQSLFEVWQELCSAIDEKYDMERLWNTGGKNWTYEYKYRRDVYKRQEMNKTLKISFSLKNTYRVNGVLFSLKQIPLVKRLLPATLYQVKGHPRGHRLYRRISGRTNTNDPRRKEGSVDEKLS